MDALRTVKVALRTKRDAASFEAMPGERLLFAGLSQGLDLPYECASGSCGSCAAQVLEAADGALRCTHPQAPALRGLAADRVLMCQTTCHGDAQLRLFGRIGRQAEGSITPRHLDGMVESSRRVGPSMFELTIRPDTPFAYKPGQFAMVSVDGVDGFRAYSMTRAPTRGASALEFIIRTRPGGGFSTWLKTQARPGVRISLFGPLGKAVLPERAPQRLVAIAGGTGIAGILSVVEAALERGDLDRCKATVIFGVRMLAEATCLDRLAAWMDIARGQLEVVVAVDHQDVNGMAAYKSLTFVPGLVTEVAEARLAKEPQYMDTCFFLAGPPVVVDHGLALLCGKRGVPRANVLFDRFQ